MKNKKIFNSMKPNLSNKNILNKIFNTKTFLNNVFVSDEKPKQNVDIDSMLLRYNIFFFNTPFNSYTCCRLNKVLLYLNKKNNDPIVIFINSPGGSIDGVLSICDIIDYINNPVITIGFGLVASAATVLLTYGLKGHRYMFPRTRTLIHQPRMSAKDITLTTTDATILSKELEYSRKQIIDIYFNTCKNKTKKQIKKDIESDFWMNSKESLEYGLIDGILDKKTTVKINDLTKKNEY